MNPKEENPNVSPRQAQFPIREERPGQIEAWRRVARADGRTLVGWIRWTLDNAAVQAPARTKPTPLDNAAAQARVVPGSVAPEKEGP